MLKFARAYVCFISLLAPIGAQANQVITENDIQVFDSRADFYCGTTLGAVGVRSTGDKRIYYSPSGQISVNSFTPRLRFYINTVEEGAPCKQAIDDDGEAAASRLGFVFAQAFNYLDCNAPEIACGTNSAREVAQVILKGSWRSPSGAPRLRKEVHFGPGQQEDWTSLLSLQSVPFETLEDYYGNPQVIQLGFRSHFHGEVVRPGFFASEPVATSAETFTRWWVPADCSVNETTHCSHTVFLFRVATSADGYVSSPTEFSISPWFTRKLFIMSWSPFNYEDNILRIVEKES